MTLTNKAYDKLKWIAQYLLPALGTLYFALASIWNLPYQKEVLGTITAITAFLGVILGISSANYEGDGIISLTQGDALIALNISEDEIAQKKLVTFKVGTIDED